MVLVSLRMMTIFPTQAPLPDGFTSPIIAFECAQSSQDIAYLLCDSNSAVEYRTLMRDGHRWDMLFPFTYAGFLFMLLLGFHRKRQTHSTVAMVLVLLIIPFDINEKLHLLAILDLAQQHPLFADHFPVQFNYLFTDLYVATWLKWGAIALVVLMLAIHYVQKRHWILAVTAIVHVSFAMACFATASKPILAEAIAVTLSLFFLVALVAQITKQITVERVASGASW